MDTIQQHEGTAGLVDSEESSTERRRIPVTVRTLPQGPVERFRMPAIATLREVMNEGAQLLHVTLLPPAPQEPLDRLHGIVGHNEVGPPIENLDQMLSDYLNQQGTTHNFGIDLVLAFRVNTRWAVATAPQMTPREILALPAIGLDHTQYTLYLPGSAAPLPIDEPVAISRGMALEAQRDGKYGAQK